MPSKHLARASLLTLTIVAAVAFWASVAFANALVVVQLRGDEPHDGRVTLTARRGEATFSCQTTNGTCRINGVPGGSYSVRFRPDEGTPPPSTQAMIPPSGTVTLHLATGH